jgi:hypothetical protein
MIQIPWMRRIRTYNKIQNKTNKNEINENENITTKINKRIYAAEQIQILFRRYKSKWSKHHFSQGLKERRAFYKEKLFPTLSRQDQFLASIVGCTKEEGWTFYGKGDLFNIYKKIMGVKKHSWVNIYFTAKLKKKNKLQGMQNILMMVLSMVIG